MRRSALARSLTFLSLFTGRTLAAADTQALDNDLRLLWAMTDASLLSSPYGNFYAAAFQRVAEGAGLESGWRRAFDMLLTTLVYPSVSGPAPYLVSYLLLSSRESSLMAFGLNLARALDLALARALSAAPLADSANTIWQRLSSDFELTVPLLEFLCECFDLTLTVLWCETLRVAFLPTIPGRIRLVDPQWWKKTRDIFIAGKVSEADTYAAASQLILDGLLHIYGYHEPDVDWLRDILGYTDDKIAELKPASAVSRGLFAELADQTRHRDDAPLRIAHCIRDLAYDDDSRTDDLTAMVESDDSAYREVFEHCYWRPTEEERQREEEDRKQAEAAEPSPTRTRKKPRTTRSR